MTPEQQQAIARAEAEAAAAAGGATQQPPVEDSTLGYLKTLLSGLREIPEGLVKAGSGLSQWEAEKVSGLLSSLGFEGGAADAKKFAGEQWQPEQIESASDTAVNTVLPQAAEGPVREFTQHQPETPNQEGLHQVTQFLPALLTKNPAGLSGGRALLSKFMTRAALPAGASDVAGDITHDVAPEAETAVRFLVGAIANPSVMKSAAAQAAAKSVTKSPAALNALRQRLVADYGDTPEGMQRAQQALTDLGVDATLMDIGPNLKQAGQQVYSKGGTGREAIFDKLKGREEAADVRGESLIRENVGPPVDEGNILKALDARKSAGAQAQRDSHPAQVADVDLTPIASKIDGLLAEEKSPQIRSKLQRVRKMLYENEPIDPDNPALETGSKPVLSARQAISEMLYNADGTPKTDVGPKTKQLLDDIYADINKQLDPANPALRAADADIAQAGKEQRAFKTGKEDVLDNNPNTAIAPEQFGRDVWDAASPGERTTLRQGLTAKIDAMRGTTANDRAALKKIIVGDGKWNHQKIAQIVGQEKADALVRGLEREKTFQDTERSVLYNSKTAETSVDDGLTSSAVETAKKGVERGAAGGVIAGAPGMAAAAATAPITGGLNMIGDALLGGRRAELGKMLASDQPKKAIDAAEQTGAVPRRSALTQMLLQALAAQGGH